ncbi:hypothetical protein A3Q56_00676 [Intoshia linei]|uniref:Uncharacterized protein n=1 Tax=Intoshia linei TaxID=1819745 RepID=A0A177BD05_9BILA|nr:hypothetical protein A3Q56_00676 [Intoshia linei]
MTKMTLKSLKKKSILPMKLFTPTTKQISLMKPKNVPFYTNQNKIPEIQVKIHESCTISEMIADIFNQRSIMESTYLTNLNQIQKSYEKLLKYAHLPESLHNYMENVQKEIELRKEISQKIDSDLLPIVRNARDMFYDDVAYIDHTIQSDRNVNKKFNKKNKKCKTKCWKLCRKYDKYLTNKNIINRIKYVLKNKNNATFVEKISDQNEKYITSCLNTELSRALLEEKTAITLANIFENDEKMTKCLFDNLNCLNAIYDQFSIGYTNIKDNICIKSYTPNGIYQDITSEKTPYIVKLNLIDLNIENELNLPDDTRINFLRKAINKFEDIKYVENTEVKKLHSRNEFKSYLAEVTEFYVWLNQCKLNSSIQSIMESEHFFNEYFKKKLETEKINIQNKEYVSTHMRFDNITIPNYKRLYTDNRDKYENELNLRNIEKNESLCATINNVNIVNPVEKIEIIETIKENENENQVENKNDITVIKKEHELKKVNEIIIEKTQQDKNIQLSKFYKEKADIMDQPPQTPKRKNEISKKTLTLDFDMTHKKINRTDSTQCSNTDTKVVVLVTPDKTEKQNNIHRTMSTVESCKVVNGKYTMRKVKYSYKSKKSDEIDLEAGDYVKVIAKLDDGWWVVDNGSERGVFPSNYIEICRYDLVIIQDKSGSVLYHQNYEPSVIFIRDIVSNLTITTADEIRVSLVTFGDSSRVVFDFDTFAGNKDALLDKIAEQSTIYPDSRAKTNSLAALESIAQMMNTARGRRVSVPLVVIMLTDGLYEIKSTDPEYNIDADIQRLRFLSATYDYFFVVAFTGVTADEIKTQYNLQSFDRIIHYSDLRTNSGIISSNDILNAVGRDTCESRISSSSTTSSYTTSSSTSTKLTTPYVGPKGEKGSKGDRGYLGAIGPQGIDGKIGGPGMKGHKGDKGEIAHIDLKSYKGTKGDKGQMGIGSKGNIGPIGFPGERGEKGYRGNQGYNGVDGTNGLNGLNGGKGERGYNGEPGPKGQFGDKGLKGDTGPTGKKGNIGLMGNLGMPGPMGPRGQKGFTGKTGIAGRRGLPGPQGPPGPISKLSENFPEFERLEKQTVLLEESNTWSTYFSSVLTCVNVLLVASVIMVCIEMFKKWYYYKVEEEYKDVPYVRISFRNILYGFIETSSTHGVTHIYYAIGILKKMFWILLTVAALSTWIVNTLWITENFLAYDVNNKISITHSKYLRFPAVTICNSNNIRKSKVDNVLLSHILLTPAAPPPKSDQRALDMANKGLSSEKNLKIQQLNIVTEYLYTLSESDRFNLGHQMDDLILDCQFEGYKCSLKKIQKIYNYLYGNCFILNLGLDNFPLHSFFTGPLNGLVLTLNAHQDEYIRLTEKVGFRVVIHDANAMPFPEEYGVDVSPGQITSIGITMKEVKRLGGKFGSCIKVGPTSNHKSINAYQEMYYWTRYSTIACQKTCEQIEIMKRCNCYDIKFAIKGVAYADINAPVMCSTTNQQHDICVHSVIESFIAGNITCTHCESPCDLKTYVLNVFSTIWPSKASEADVLSSLSAKSDLAKTIIDNTAHGNNLAKVEIYFEELNLELIQEQESYSLANYLSDFGGAMGLYLGISVLSFFEYFEMLSDIIVWIFWKLCCRSKVKVVEAQGESKESVKRPHRQICFNAPSKLDTSIKLETDTSDFGIGATLLQDGKPIRFASKTLDATQRNYSTTHKEFLAVYWSITNFIDIYTILTFIKLVDEKIVNIETNKLLVPKGKNNELIKKIHEGIGVNHMAIKKTYRMMRRAYFWPGISISKHHEGIGLAERTNRTIKDLLRVKLNWDNNLWEDQMPGILLALRNCYTEGTNVSPASIVYGHELEILNLDENDTSLYWLRDRENEIITAKKLFNYHTKYNRRVKRNFDKTVPNGMTYWKNNYRINEKKVKKLDDPYVPRNINWIDKEKDNNPCYNRKQENNITLPKYCICKMPENDTDFMIECLECLNWFHGKCIKIKKRHLVDKNYYCTEICMVDYSTTLIQVLELELLKKSSTAYRNRYLINYASIKGIF